MTIDERIMALVESTKARDRQLATLADLSETTGRRIAEMTAAIARMTSIMDRTADSIRLSLDRIDLALARLSAPDRPQRAG